ncbi:MAG: hypothetical protein LBS54_03365 [Dysgonamonadaceae bacterium]|jgi:hypothetical protein|nr:hypothetical protein [Dysgonamonadaceae bacterium]
MKRLFLIPFAFIVFTMCSDNAPKASPNTGKVENTVMSPLSLNSDDGLP